MRRSLAFMYKPEKKVTNTDCGRERGSSKRETGDRDRQDEANMNMLI